MKKPVMCLMLTTMIGALASGNALADAQFHITLDGDLDWNGRIDLHNTESQPTGPTDCLQYGNWGGDKDTADIFFTLGPPFKGSASRSRYGTLCHRVNNDWITIHYGIDLSSCAMWVCDTKYWYQITRDTTILHHRTEQITTITSTINFWFTDASGNICSSSNCP